MIMQKNGAGLHTASSCFWNNDTDGSCTVSTICLRLTKSKFVRYCLARRVYTLSLFRTIASAVVNAKIDFYLYTRITLTYLNLF